jgi:primase-polymerase (primpol)-like protein
MLISKCRLTVRRLPDIMTNAWSLLYDELKMDENTFDIKMTENRRYKYSEDDILKELNDYIAGTYNQHYSAGDDKIQTLDLIEACGDGEAFCRSNILKYASRYDKKGTARRDIMKILHYAVLLMHFNDKNAKREDYPNR